MEYVKYILAILWGLMVSFILPISHFLIFTVVLVVVDFVTGILAARKRKETLKSRGFSRTVSKVVLYFVAILLANGMDVVFLWNIDAPINFTYLVTGFVCLTEFKSNLENIGFLTGVDIWKNIAKKIPNLFKIK